MSKHRGAWLVIFVLFMCGALVLFAAMHLQSPRRARAMSTVLVFDVPSGIEEAEPPHRMIPYGIGRRGQNTVFRAVQTLDRAAVDPTVRSLMLRIDGVDWGWGRLAELRDAVARFRAHGKPVYAILTGGGEAEYALATVAELVAAPPTAMLYINGLSASAMFLRGTFDKLDIRPNFTSAGRYKSGVEQYTRTEMSGPAREAMSVMLDDIFENLVDTLAVARGLPRDSVFRLFDQGPFAAPDAAAAGLIDTVLYAEDVDSLASRRAGSSVDRVSLFRYADRLSLPSGPRVALITASGAIVPGKSRYVTGEGAVVGSETLVGALREARTRRAIKAVVLRIDSPGGVIDAADEIWREVKRLRETKPVFVSMSDVAASGGYYIAAPATGIVAQPGTITGSIGVYSGKLNLLGLYRKLGLNVETVSRGLHAEMLSPFRDFTPEEAELHQRSVDASYRTFLDRVCDGRGLTLAEADSMGQGRVWSGTSAYHLGLVDTLGGMNVAFDLALEAAGYDAADGYSVEVLPRVEHTLFDRLVEEWLTSDDATDAGAELAAPLNALLAAARFPAGRVLAMLPWSIEIR